MEKAAREAAPRLRRDFNEVEALQVSRKGPADFVSAADNAAEQTIRSEEHTSELQSLMRISYAVFCLKNKKTDNYTHKISPQQYTPNNNYNNTTANSHH